jgi:hypothetical protein
MAPLELAMIFPFLLLLVAAIFFVARAVTARTAAITKVRHDAFARRDQASPGAVLQPSTTATASLVTANATGPVAGGLTFPGMTFQAKGVNSTTGRTWGTFGQDQQEVSFVPSSPFFVASPTPLGLLSSQVGVPDLGPFTTMNPASTPTLAALLGPASQLQGAINNCLTLLSAVPAAINSLPLCQVAFQIAQAALALSSPFSPQLTAQLETQIQMVLNLISTAAPCLNSLIGANNGSGGTWDSSLGSQLSAIQINLSILQYLNQVAAFGQ